MYVCMYVCLCICLSKSVCVRMYMCVINVDTIALDTHYIHTISILDTHYILYTRILYIYILYTYYIHIHTM